MLPLGLSLFHKRVQRKTEGLFATGSDGRFSLYATGECTQQQLKVFNVFFREIRETSPSFPGLSIITVRVPVVTPIATTAETGPAGRKKQGHPTTKTAIARSLIPSLVKEPGTRIRLISAALRYSPVKGTGEISALAAIDGRYLRQGPCSARRLASMSASHSCFCVQQMFPINPRVAMVSTTGRNQTAS